MAKFNFTGSIKTAKDAKVSKRDVIAWITSQLPEAGKIGDVEVTVTKPKVEAV